jgi:hypothetical protein
MIVAFAQLIFVTFLLLLAKRAIEWYGYKKMGEAFEREAALRREWKVGIPYDPREEGERSR